MLLFWDIAIASVSFVSLYLSIGLPNLPTGMYTYVAVMWPFFVLVVCWHWEGKCFLLQRNLFLSVQHFIELLKI